MERLQHRGRHRGRLCGRGAEVVLPVNVPGHPEVSDLGHASWSFAGQQAVPRGDVPGRQKEPGQHVHTQDELEEAADDWTALRADGDGGRRWRTRTVDLQQPQT